MHAHLPEFFFAGAESTVTTHTNASTHNESKQIFMTE
jgi:hypothetical protein